MVWDDGLRGAQRVIAGAQRQNMVVLAGPGTGKTFVLVRRIQFLVEELRVSPSRILALAFTRAAAAEMRARLEQRLGQVGKQVRVSTVHSYALSEILREGASQLPEPIRVAGNWEERWIVVEELAQILDRDVRAITNNRRNGALDRLADDWDTLAADGDGWESGHPDPGFLTAWRQHREVYGYTLRSELVYQLLCELRSNPDFSPAENFSVVLVDEYQDLNRCDLDAIRFIVERSNAEILGAGDDDQSIYLFRHAHPLGIRSFASTYQSWAPQLMECMRCGPAVVEIANWLIEQELDRVPKALISVTDWPASVHLVRFPNEASEAAGVARIVEREISRGLAPEQVLILMKSDKGGRVSGAVQGALQGFGIQAYLPRKGQTMEDDFQILLEYLILSVRLRESGELDDLAIRALLQLEDNNIGTTRIRRLVEFAFENGLRFTRALEIARTRPSDFPPGRFEPLFAAVHAIKQRASSIEPHYDENFANWLARACLELELPEDTVAILNETAASLLVTDESSVDPTGTTNESDARPTSRFVQDLLVAMTGLSETLPATLENHVTITTMHGAKGLSADLVVLLQVEDEVIPGESQGPEFNESRRLLYVSMTRAKKKLLITACNRRRGPQRFVGQQLAPSRTLSRFIRDFGLVATGVDHYLRSLGS
ncbi:MAG: ATP-dependent helicase [Actinomycetota bacterium]